MSDKKDPWYVVLTSYFSYLLVLVVGLGLGYKVGKGGGSIASSVTFADSRPIMMADKEVLQIRANSDATKVLSLTGSSSLDVTVEEISGRNIEFNVLQDSHVIYASGIRKGTASGHFRALPGLCTIKVLNGHMLDGKQVALTVKASPLE